LVIDPTTGVAVQAIPRWRRRSEGGIRALPHGGARPRTL